MYTYLLDAHAYVCISAARACTRISGPCRYHLQQLCSCLLCSAGQKEGRRQLPRSVAPSGSGSTSEGRQLPSTQPSQQEVAESGGKPARRKRSAGGKQRRVCSHCGKSGGDGVKLQACARCQDVLYCGRECQTSHWPSHKPECKPKQPKPEN